MSRNITQRIHSGQEEKGNNARLQYYVGGIAVCDMVKSTLGPHGSDKILLPVGTEPARMAKATITNDGATILSRVWLDNPAAQIMVDVARTQDKSVGDGTTGVVVLAGELLRQAEILTDQRIHPSIIVEGYEKAAKIAVTALESASAKMTDELLRDNLLRLARTTLSSKIVRFECEKMAEVAVDAVLRLEGNEDIGLIHIIKIPGASLSESYLDEGFILEKDLPPYVEKSLEGCKVLLTDTPMDADKVKIFSARVRVESFSQVKEIEDAEKLKMSNKVASMCATGCNVTINRQLIYDFPNQCFRKHKVLPIEHADFDGIERLSLVLDGDIASTFDAPEKIKLGSCDKIEQILIGEKRFIQFTGCAKKKACTIVLRGSTDHVLDEAERSIHDALANLSQTVRDGRFVYGGGSVELHCAEAIEKEARKTEGKLQLPLQAFSKALVAVPTILLDNGGFDSAETVARLRALHHQHREEQADTDPSCTLGVDLETGGLSDMRKVGVLESLWSKTHQLRSASEAAQMIIRCDEVVRCAPRRREGM
eukprot:GHVH01004603.1.p1 GENE.GHVH01004603.1~~GHVH01004603.1.p1  ORF type:complete len:539 (+),score=72.28 GHVH01004603.1:50-1666(+)